MYIYHHPTHKHTHTHCHNPPHPDHNCFSVDCDGDGDDGDGGDVGDDDNDDCQGVEGNLGAGTPVAGTEGNSFKKQKAKKLET